MSFRVEGLGVVTPGHIAVRVSGLLKRERQAMRRARREIDPAVAVWLAEVIDEGDRYRRAMSETAVNGSNGTPFQDAGRTMPTMTTTEVADRLGCGTRNVRDLADRHGFGRKVGGRWMFDLSEIDDYARERAGS